MSGRIRTVKPEWLEDELLASASDEARVLSVALILIADDHGRGRAALAAIASEAWRYHMERDDGASVPEILARASRALRELVEMRYVHLYEVRGQRYFAIRNWEKHQKVDRPSKPRVPAPSEADDASENPENTGVHATLARPSRDPREPLDESSRLTPTPTSTSDHRSPTSERGPARARPGAIEGQPFGDWLRDGVVKGYRSIKQPAPRETRDLLWSGWHELEAWVAEKAELTGKPPPDVGRHLIRCFLRSKEAKRRGWPIGFLVQNAAEYWRDELPPAEVA